MVYIDGQYAGVTPVTIPNVAKGKHIVGARKFKCAPWKQVVTVAKDKETVAATLSQLGTGVLHVVSRPAGATLIVDGVPKGKTPAVVRDVAIGSHTVRLELDEWLPWQGSTNVAEGKDRTVEATLKFKGEDLLLAEIRKLPHKIVNYYELAHHYALQNEFDKMLDAFAKGFDACVHPDARTDESRRLYQEIDRVHTGQYDYASADVIASLRPKVIEVCRAAIKRQPRNVSNYWALGTLLQREGKWEEVLAVHEAGLKAMKTARGKMYYECLAAGAMYQLGYTLERQGKYVEAIAQYEALLKKYPKPWHARNALQRIATIAQSRLKDYKRVVALNRKFIGDYPDADSCPTVQLGIAAMLRDRLKDYAAAIAEYRVFLKRYPKDDRRPEAQFGIAEIYRNTLKDYDRAIQEYRTLLKVYPKYDGCANALRAIGDSYTALAAQAYQELADQYPQSVAASVVDKTPKRVRARAKAKSLFDAARALDSQAATQHSRGTSWARQGQRLQSKDAARAKQLLDQSSTAQTQAQQLAKKAVASYQRIVKSYRAYHYARDAQQRIIAIYGGALADPTSAIKARQDFVRLFPDDDTCPRVQYDIGNAYFKGLREHEKAVVELRKVITNHPESDQCVSAQYLIARMYSHDNGHYIRERQIEEHARLIKDYPDYDGNASAQSSIGRNYHYRVLPDDEVLAAKAYFKIVQDYPYTSTAVATEYRLDQHGGGLQLAELEADGKVVTDKKTGRRVK